MDIRLWFLWLPGCSACAAAKPHLRRFQQQNPQVDVLWGSVDPTMFAWPEDAKGEPQAFPAYYLQVPRKRVDIRYGAIEDSREIERWVDQIAGEAGILPATGGGMPRLPASGIVLPAPSTWEEGMPAEMPSRGVKGFSRRG